MGDDKVCGMVNMQTPFLIAKDLDVVKKILIKDFNHFVNRREFESMNNQPLVARMLANLRGDEWKGVRTALSPTFTSGKIRRMMEAFDRVSNEWVQHLNEEVTKNCGKGIEINVMKETTNYTIDVIANAVFGMNAGAMRNPDEVFAKMSHKFTNVGLKQIFKFSMAMALPKLSTLIGLQIFDQDSLNFFETILRQGLEARMKGTEKKNDFIQLIAEARKGQLKTEGSDELDLFEKEAMLKEDWERKNWLKDDVSAVAQMLQFFVAGFSTTSNFIGFLMYSLALNQEWQEKVREEINDKLFKNGNDSIDYDVLNNLNYLEMFVSEVNRKFPAVGRLERKCNMDYVDPENNFKVPKDAVVIIPVQAIHNDPQYFEFPDKFYPEHFSPENKANRSPYAYLPFGLGPRGCIGMRFAIIESKAAIVHLIHKFRIEPTKSTPIPIKTKAVAIGSQMRDDIELKITPL